MGTVTVYMLGAARVPLLALASLIGGTLASVPDRAVAEPALTLSRGPENVEVLEFSLDELRALPQTTIETENEFSDGIVSYSGPLVRDVLEHLTLDQSEMLRFVAANDYFVEIPTSDFRKYNVILAMEADGERLSRRDKGPLWLMYPISDHEELRDPLYIHRLIWQVDRIESLPE